MSEPILPASPVFTGHQTEDVPGLSSENNGSQIGYAEATGALAFAKWAHPTPAAMRVFETGATRNTDVNKFDYEGFLSPTALEAFGEYMHTHRRQADGSLRASDNWQKGISLPVYMKSMLRHVFDLWAMHRGCKRYSPEDGHELTMKEVCSSVLFNVMGYLHETLKADASKADTQ